MEFGNTRDDGYIGDGVFTLRVSELRRSAWADGLCLIKALRFAVKLKQIIDMR